MAMYETGMNYRKLSIQQPLLLIVKSSLYHMSDAI